MTRSVMALAGEVCSGRLVLILEGGYDLEALRESVGAVLIQLSDSDIPVSTGNMEIPVSGTFQKIWKRFCAVHGLFWNCFAA